MQNMWISVALIVAVIIVGIIAGKRLSTPGPQRRAVYFAFGTLAVLALWFFIFVAFFPAEWIVPFFTVACIIIPICVYMMVLRSGGKERAKVPSKRSFEIPKKDMTSPLKAQRLPARSALEQLLHQVPQRRPRGREGLHPCAHGNRTSVRLCHKMGFLLSWLGHRKMGAHYCACRLNCTRPHPSALLERDRGGHDRALCSFDLQAPQESSKSAAARIVTRKGTE